MSNEDRLSNPPPAPEARPSAPPQNELSGVTAVEGTPFGKYQLVKKIGVGGMASIHLASLEGPDGFQKKVVVKRVHAHLAEVPGFSDMFATEARVAARLSHPHVAQVYEYGTIDATPYLAMEWVDGPTLHQLIRHAARAGVTLPPELAIVIGVQLCDALHYAHELCHEDGRWMGLVHRDVSPSNVLVGLDGGVKLIDFGIAKETEGPSMTKTGMLKGKLAYMAPEQLAGSVDRRTDVFALGVVLYELAVSKRLFKRATDAETLTAVVQCQVADPRRLVPGFPSDLAAVLERALEKDPSRRYSSAAEMGHDLEEIALRRGISVSRRGVLTALKELPLEGLGAGKGASSWSSPSRPSTPSLSGTRSMEDSDPLLPALAPPELAATSSNAIPIIVGITAVLLLTIAMWWVALG
ncbi:MAG: serine/threonine protein kinase [Sandaracinus sp.]|nr:serine/threonine protein kinase [Sandaracinus sp.]MCB9615497.1 serine/threonine protein kinase [Sandaracinus sp.]MCB9617909.1 serine/threonine protein kinase [Sandaracinus sp.]MCB9623692.1 serine/threonine protein kinase [Sandaracinus sp.]MCB9634488.1 serine/threonine protein kinase [Sandaracinus sp.]